MAQKSGDMAGRRVTFYVSDEALRRRLKVLAAEHDVSVSEFVRQIVERSVQRRNAAEAVDGAGGEGDSL